MTMRNSSSGCPMHGLSRRTFLGACAACAGAAVLGGPRAALAAEGGKVRIRVLYALFAPKQPRPTWPHIGFDFVPVMERFNTGLAAQFPNYEFLPAMAAGPEEAAKIVKQDKDANIDGYLVFQMNNWPKVVQTAAATGKPTLYADFTYAGSGGFMQYTAAFLRRKATNVGFVASSRMEDLVEAVKCFEAARGNAGFDFAAATARVRRDRTPKPGDLACTPDPVKCISTEECLARMKASKILTVRNQKPGPAAPVGGIPMENVSFAEVNEAWKAADKDQAREAADRWQKSAASIVDVSRETLETSAAMYLGMKAVLKKRGANAITIDCLGGFYGGHIHAYPCLGFHELNNAGLVGACECDVRSTATMVAITALTQGRPGYISDPVIDTSNRRIIYAHCVAPNRVFGPQGPANPFHILTHSEDRQGAAVRSILPQDYMTTTLKIWSDKKEMLFHQAKAVGNDPDDRACRTKLVAEPVGDIEKLFVEWDRWSWHRVTFYGDLKAPVFALAEALGYKVIEEA